MARSGAVIAPYRAMRAGLDYLGFGDWHGRIEVSPNTWYSGTPEPDSFKPHRPAGALLVGLASHGAAPEVKEVMTGQIGWTRVTLDLLDTEDATERLTEALPDLARRERTLIDIRATGRAGLAGHAALARAVDDVAPDFLWANCDLSALAITPEADDLSLIDDLGAGRDAAKALAAAADSGDTAAAAALSLRNGFQGISESGACTDLCTASCTCLCTCTEEPDSAGVDSLENQ
jgi:hypothetical protein